MGRRSGRGSPREVGIGIENWKFCFLEGDEELSAKKEGMSDRRVWCDGGRERGFTAMRTMCREKAWLFLGSQVG